MSSRENMAHNYLIFRSPTEYLIVFLPTMVGIFNNMFNKEPQLVGSINSGYIDQYQFQDLNTYLLFSKITIIVLIAFFVCYRWASMLIDGSYGFWLTAGIIREKFFLRTIIKFSVLLFFSQVLGILLLSYVNQYVFPFFTFLQLLVSVYSGVLFQVVLAVFLSNTLRNPEFASLSYIAIMGFNLGFNSSTSGFLYLLFQSDLAYISEDAILGTIFSLVFSAVMFFIALRIHLSQDIDI